MLLHENRFAKAVRKLLDLIASTRAHPQWFIKRFDHLRFVETANAYRGSVLDIGFSDQQLSQLLPQNTEYIGLDYWDTAANRYQTCPSVLGDARHLPFKAQSIDTVVLLEVVEHIPVPESVIKEINRVLKPNGRLVMSMPFMYPLHVSTS